MTKIGTVIEALWAYETTDQHKYVTTFRRGNFTTTPKNVYIDTLCIY
jgi:hypothetical protein